MSDLSYEEIEAVREEILSSLHCALPGQVKTLMLRPAQRLSSLC